MSIAEQLLINVRLKIREKYLNFENFIKTLVFPNI